MNRHYCEWYLYLFVANGRTQPKQARLLNVMTRNVFPAHTEMLPENYKRVSLL